jgi:uncharacterized protein
LQQKRFTLLVSTEIIFEYYEVLARRQTLEFANFTIELFAHAPNIVAVTPYYRLNLIYTDPDDNKFADCAFAGNADAIVTEDVHFDILKTIPFPKIAVLSVSEFADFLTANPA